MNPLPLTHHGKPYNRSPQSKGNKSQKNHQKSKVELWNVFLLAPYILFLTSMFFSVGFFHWSLNASMKRALKVGGKGGTWLHPKNTIHSSKWFWQMFSSHLSQPATAWGWLPIEHHCAVNQMSPAQIPPALTFSVSLALQTLPQITAMVHPSAKGTFI